LRNATAAPARATFPCARMLAIRLTELLGELQRFFREKKGSQELGASLENKFFASLTQTEPAAKRLASVVYTVKELPQPQVLFTLGLLNLNPAPSSVSM